MKARDLPDAQNEGWWVADRRHDALTGDLIALQIIKGNYLETIVVGPDTEVVNDI